MTEMVERVAKAMHDAVSVTGEPWDPTTGHKGYYDAQYKSARAAVEAMREPTEEMVRSVGSEWGPALEDNYQRMIDAALKE